MDKIYENQELNEAYQIPFIKLMDIELVSCAKGRCVIELQVQDKHKQHKGFVHGGILAALIDHTGGSAAASAIADDEYVLTSDINVSYIRPALPPRIRFVGETIKLGERLCYVDVKVYNLTPEEKICTVGRLTLPRLKKNQA